MGTPLLIWVLLVPLFLVTPLVVVSEQEDVRNSLVAFLRTLSANDSRVERDLRWNASTDPCSGVGWKGITCNQKTNSTKRIVLQDLRLRGSIDAGLLCRPPSLVFVSISGNDLHGGIPPEISGCTRLTHLLLPGNRLSGSLPPSLSTLNNLKKFDISDNGFSGTVPDVGRISGLLVFLVQSNNLTGGIPRLQFSNLQQFNVSHNSFRGLVPAEAGRFGLSSLADNSGLCGGLPTLPACPAPPPSASQGEKHGSQNGHKLVMYLGYVLLAVAVLVFFAYKVITRNKKRTKINMVEKEKKQEAAAAAAMAVKQGEGLNSGSKKNGEAGSTAGVSRSEFSISSSEGSSAAKGSTSLVVLRNPRTTSTKELKFQELLKAPAELMGRGRHGSVYRAMLDDGTAVAVKRLKDGGVPAPEEFRRRMERVDQVGRHAGVLPALAFYCSDQEKLVVYEYQAKGSLFNLLHGGQNNGQRPAFDWSSRLSAAAGICDCLAYMHQELRDDGIAHGSVRSSNVLFDDHMHPRISEYGLSAVVVGGGGGGGGGGRDPFPADVHGFGVILLELLTGKVVEGSSGLDLARWVNSVVREEWTGEVFDGGLFRGEGASEGRMVRMLQVALKCIGSSPGARPDMKQVAAMVASIVEEDDRSCNSSTVSEPGGESR